MTVFMLRVITLATTITLATSNQKVRHRCPMPATSILKMIRNFRLVEARYSSDETPPIKCAVSYLTLQSIVTFHSESFFFNILST